MSKYIDQIIARLRLSPDMWTPIRGGVMDSSTCITRVGNSAILSILAVYVNDVEMPTTYMDRFRLEREVNRWYRSASMSVIEKA